MLKLKIKCDELLCDKKRKTDKPEEDHKEKQSIALTTLLEKVSNSSKENHKTTGDKNKTASWKFDKTLGSPMNPTPRVLMAPIKHISGAMALLDMEANKVCGISMHLEHAWCKAPNLMLPRTIRPHPPETTTENTKTKINGNTIQALLQAILEKAQPRDNISATLFAILGAIKLMKVPLMRPYTKCIDIQYHHFREVIEQKKISISHVSTEEQVANITDKPLLRYSFQCFHMKLMGW
jgi:hypothetical protein